MVLFLKLYLQSLLLKGFAAKITSTSRVGRSTSRTVTEKVAETAGGVTIATCRVQLGTVGVRWGSGTSLFYVTTIGQSLLTIET